MTLRWRLSVAGAVMAVLAVSLAPSLHARQHTGRMAGNGGVTVVLTPSAADDDAHMAGQTVYDERCSRCHGPQGQDGKAPSLVPFRWTLQQALDIVRHGGSCGMPAFSESDLSDDRVKQIVEYLKTLK